MEATPVQTPDQKEVNSDQQKLKPLNFNVILLAAVLTFIIVLGFMGYTEPGQRVSDVLLLGDAEKITFEEFVEALKEPGVVVVDVRPRYEYVQGHIPGAVNVEAEKIKQFAKSVTDQKIVMYCGETSCDLIENLATQISSSHQEEVYFVSEAIYNDWQEEGHPVEKKDIFHGDENLTNYDLIVSESIYSEFDEEGITD